MTSFIFGVCGFLFGMLVGFRMGIDSILDEMDDDIVEVKRNTEEDIPIYIETDDIKYYAYNENTHKFIAQGKDIDELQDNIIARYPNSTFIIAESNLDSLGI